MILRRRRRSVLTTLCASLGISAAVAAFAVTPSAAYSSPVAAVTAAHHLVGAPDLGPNVYVFSPTTPQAQIQSTVDAIAQQQVGNQFGEQRYALLFEPGTYGSDANPLNFHVGYYTEVAGLGRTPGDVVVNGSIDVDNQCDANGFCTALNNFWRSMSNLSITVANPDAGCYQGEFWAVSQAAPMRRVHVDGNTTFMDYCTGPSYASGGFVADSTFTNGSMVNGSQQQFYVRNSAIDSWSNGVWNQVFSGDTGAPAQCFPAASDCGPYTTLATTPASRVKPYLWVDGRGRWQVFVPTAGRNTSGPSDRPAGHSIPLSRFDIARPADGARAMNRALADGKNLLLTPGVYHLARPLAVTRANTVVMGLGLATLTADNRVGAVRVAGVPGVELDGVIIDAGAGGSEALVMLARGHRSSAANPTTLQDVFFRVAGPHAGSAATSLRVDANHVILDDVWAWRADHGTGVGWTDNTAATGVRVNGADVNATGLFVEHYQRYQTIWNGRNGSDVFYQSEMPYDPPSQQAWLSHHGTVAGYASFKATPDAYGFRGYGMGVYSFFNEHVDIHAANAFEVAQHSNQQLSDILTIFLDAVNGSGGIDSVVDGTGGSSTAANADTPVTVTTYPA